jgi:protein TonB
MRKEPAIFSALVLASALIHGGLLAALNREPPPMASIGIEAISVELVLGANSSAGPATTPSEAQSPPSPGPTEPEPPPVPREAALAPADVPPDAAPQPPPEDPSRPQATAPAEVTAEPRTEQPVTSHQEAALPPKEPESRRPEEPRKPVAQPPSSPARKPQRRDSTNRARPAATDPRVDNRRVAALPPAGAPSGVGPGRSDSDTNYRGTAAAHLARYKQFPAEARSRGEQGTSVVSFSIDGSGRVTRVSLVRSTGIASLDRESEAMVRRASPFPPPPGGRPITLSAPVNFHLR